MRYILLAATSVALWASPAATADPSSDAISSEVARLWTQLYQQHGARWGTLAILEACGEDNLAERLEDEPETITAPSDTLSRAMPEVTAMRLGFVLGFREAVQTTAFLMNRARVCEFGRSLAKQALEE